VRVDDVTIRAFLPDGEGRAAAWIIDVSGRGAWWVRCRDMAAGPFTLDAAKRAAPTIVQGGYEGNATKVTDPIAWLNRAAAREVA
jgi:hypothetical protein